MANLALQSHPAEAVDDEEEEEVCRICRGPSEEDNPLFYPCKCSGSIKFVHQQCLIEWLQHSGNTHCEVRLFPVSSDMAWHLPRHYAQFSTFDAPSGSRCGAIKGVTLVGCRQILCKALQLGPSYTLCQLAHVCKGLALQLTWKT